MDTEDGAAALLGLMSCITTIQQAYAANAQVKFAVKVGRWCSVGFAEPDVARMTIEAKPQTTVTVVLKPSRAHR